MFWYPYIFPLNLINQLPISSLSSLRGGGLTASRSRSKRKMRDTVVTIRINNVTSQTLRFVIINGFVYLTLYTFMCKFDPLRFLFVVNGSVFAAWMVAQGTFVAHAVMAISSLLGLDLQRFVDVDDNEDTEVPPEMISKVRMRRDKPLDIPKGMLIFGCDNGYREADDELFFAGQITLKQYKRRRKKVMIVDLIRVQDFEKWMKRYERDNESVEQQPSALESQMENIFLCPNKFAGNDSMLARPLSFFGSAFSQCDWSHFITNMYSLWSFKDLLLCELDRKTFTRLYLFSHICGKMFTMGLYEFGPSGMWRHSHGASAALSGVMSFAFVNNYSTYYITFGGVEINAGLAYIIGQFYTDIAGVLKSKTVWQFGRLWNRHILSQDEDRDAEDFEESINGNVGFSSHIGGALGGVLMAWFERSGRYSGRRWR
mmetsp:Transcript_2985/g.6062  ORF Transcript_2985/g.6062 Transcript_2985/m.6062 type:complete len:429 (+) Transcript_2985:244-1530(+)|eukprot:CAMPEP_0118642686 /NCGR_PEP_ID=MMETSP0785-20121206/5966_1 /TAXON_ID=91992 /ORGANISM="Bolidomonas pacifica, Strain CCMP 1866" /LENGTH=428 /DNA_ID=CAMNT_0006534251 /DNA_START=181 /DNA_END=1464 /DNA_ORIENTATION=+